MYIRAIWRALDRKREREKEKCNESARENQAKREICKRYARDIASLKCVCVFSVLFCLYDHFQLDINFLLVASKFSQL